MVASCRSLTIAPQLGEKGVTFIDDFLLFLFVSYLSIFYCRCHPGLSGSAAMIFAPGENFIGSVVCMRNSVLCITCLHYSFVR